MEQALDRSTKKTSGFQDKLGKASKVAAVGLAGLAGAGYKAYRSASDLNEASNATGLIFKTSRGEIDEFVKSATKIGQSERAAREATTTFGGLLQNLEFTRKESIGWSKDLTVLASDMGSAFNTDPAEAVEAIGSALRGETEPIRKYNVMLDDATVRQKAVSMGLAKTTAAVTKNGKAQAALALVMEQTKAVHGDFVKTADQGANAERVLAAEAENASAQFGKVLLPAMQGVLGVGRKLLAWTVDHKKETQILVGIVGGLAVGVLAVSGAMKVYAAGQVVASAATWLFVGSAEKAAAVTRIWAGVQWLLNAALAANPIVLIVIALVALAAALVIAWKKSETFRKIVTGAWEAIKDTTKAVFDWVGDKISGTIAFLADLVRKHPLVWLITHFDEIKEAVVGKIEAIPGAISGFFTDIYNKAKELGGKIVGGALDGIKGIAGAVWNVISGIATRIIEGYATIIGWGVAIGVRIKDAVRDAVVGIGNAVWNVVNNIWERLLAGIETVKGWGSSAGNWIKDAVVGAVVGIGTGVWGVVTNIWDRFLEAADKVKSWGSKLGGWIKDAIVDAVSGVAKAVWNKIQKDFRDWSPPGLPSVPPVKDWFGGGDTGQRIPTPTPSAGAVGSLLGASPLLGHAAGIGASFGLGPTSGLRPWDTDSKHGYGKAIDISNTYRGDPDGTPQMDRAFPALVGYSQGAGRGLIDELFYDPAGYSVDRGRIGRFIVGGHGDHIHIGLFDKGGWLAPHSATLAINQTPHWEPVGPPMPPTALAGGGNEYHFHFPNYVGSKDELVRVLKQAAHDYARDNGRGLFAGRPSPGF